MSSETYSFTKARNNFKEVLDAAEQGRTATIDRDGQRAVIVNAERLQHTLSVLSRGQVQVVAEPDMSWTLLLPGTPIAAQASDFDVAVAGFIEGLRDHAQDWQQRLRLVPNHADNWGLVQLVELSDQYQLRQWILGADS